MNAVERAESVVLGWARLYSRGVTPDARDRRLDELASDCFEQRHWGSEVGASPVAVAISMVARTMAGMPADLLWRQAQLATARDRSPHPKGRPMGQWIKDNWWVALAGVVGVMFTAAGVMYPFEGEVEGGLPWWGGMLVMLGFGVLMLGGVWQRRRRRVAGDVMIAVATLPLFPLFWTVILPVLGLLILLPAVIDAADARATGAPNGAGASPAGRDQTTVMLLAVTGAAVVASLVIGKAGWAFALVAPPIAVTAAHLVLRRAAFPTVARLGLTAMLAGFLHGLLLTAIVVLGDDGIVTFSGGPAFVSNIIMSTAGMAGLVAFLLATFASREKARPA